MQLPDFYKILGLGDDASSAEIKAAFRRLALKYHPDRNPGDPEAIELFSAIHKAYDVLSDPVKRAEYDSKRNQGVKIFHQTPLQTLVDRNRITITVDKRVIMLDETIRVVITIFEDHTKVTINGLHRFDIVQGPVISSFFPPGPHSPEVEIVYILKPKDAGYIEIGPASYLSNRIRYLSESVYIKVNPPPELVKFRPASRLEKFQSAVVSALIIFYSFLIGYNVYQFKISPYMSDEGAAVFQRSPAPLSLGLTDTHLSTGAVPYGTVYGRGKYDHGSLNRIVFHNGKTHDAVVLLTDLQTDRPVRNNYIKAGDDFIMQHIPDGKYYLQVLFGNDWNDTLRLPEMKGVSGGFNRNMRLEIFRQQIHIIQMLHSRSGDTLNYKIYEITLYPVSGGNMPDQPMNSFPHTTSPPSSGETVSHPEWRASRS